MNIAKFMVSKDDLVTLRQGDTVQRAIEKMAKNNVGSVVIADGNQVVGIVTTQDILQIISSRKSAGLSKTMKDIMSTTLISIKSSASKNEAIKLMEENDIHHILVKDGKNNYTGIISSFDLIEEVSQDLKAHPWSRN